MCTDLVARMPRHKLTLEEQIAGTRKALENPKTPKQFLPSLRDRLESLQHQMEMIDRQLEGERT